MLIRPVSIEELLAKGRDLFTAHHAEVGLDVGPGMNPPLTIDEDLFRRLDAVGVLLAFGLFTADGELAGYVAGYFSKHQFADELVCSGGALFVAPEHRRQNNGRKLMDTFEAEAKARGAAVHWHAKHGSTFERILARRGARELETIFVAKG